MIDFNELLKKSCQKYRKQIAFVKEKEGRGEKVTYFQFYYEIQSMVQALKRLTNSNENVGLIAENRYEWCVVFFATCISGKKLYLLDPNESEKELRKEIKDCKIQTVFFSNQVQEKVINIFETKKSSIRYLIHLDQRESTQKVIAYEALLTKGRYFQNYQTEEEKREYQGKPSVIFFTSGTQGKKKAVMLSQQNMVSNMVSLQRRVKISYRDNFVLLLPLYHSYACTMGFLWPISKGARICFSKGYSSFYEELGQKEASVLLGVPKIYEDIESKIIDWAKKENNDKVSLQKKKLQQILGKKMRFLFCGAATLEPQVSYFFQKRRYPIYQVYGLTEASPVISMESASKSRKGSVGKVLDGGRIKIDKQNEEGIGEICYQGPNVMLGYEGEESLNKKRIQDGWLKTGDLGYLDSKGFLHFAGRKDNRIVRKNGENIYPEEIENRLKKIKEIKEVVVCEKHDRLVAQIVARKKEKTAQDKIEEEIAKLNESQPSYKRIQKIEWKENEFEKTASWKIKRKENKKEA